MPGPPKRSNTHKRGTGSKKTHTGEDLAPELITKKPPAPPELDEHGVSEWDRVCRLAIEQEILTEWDLAALKIMCLEYSRYMTALQHIQQNGEYFTTSTGYEQIRPSSKVRNQAYINYCKLLRLFGGDVEARAKMKRIKPPQEENNVFGEL